MDDFAFIPVHRFQDDAVAVLLDAVRQTDSQLFQRFFPAMTVIFNIEHNEMARRFALIRRQVGQVLESIQGLSMLAD